MRLGVPKETAPEERRVALVPETVGRLPGRRRGGRRDGRRRRGGVRATRRTATAGATRRGPVGRGVVAKVAAPTAEEAARLASGQALIGFLGAAPDAETAVERSQPRACRRSRSSRSRASRVRSRWTRSRRRRRSPGYKAALLAADRLPRFFPMLTTAAGTIRSGEGARDRRRRRRAAGDRDRATARRGRLGVRRAAGGGRAGAVARRDVPRPRRRRRGDRGRLRAGAHPRAAGGAAGRAAGADPAVRRR